jgi:hypothetical protein
MQHTHPFSNNVAESPELVVKNWVARISVKQSGLGGNRICPFARMPRVISVEKLCLEDFVKIDSNKISGFRTRLSKYLKDLGLQKKRYNDGFYYYGIVENQPIYHVNVRDGKPKIELSEIMRKRSEESNHFVFVSKENFLCRETN